MLNNFKLKMEVIKVALPERRLTRIIPKETPGLKADSDGPSIIEEYSDRS